MKTDFPFGPGDIILTGRFKNKRTVVREIGEDEHGHPTVNGKPALNFKIEKLLPRDLWSKRSKEEFIRVNHKRYEVKEA